ncbi:MAG TPA: hypothetical protein DCM45_05495, partial [Clostridiales bacterium]|nr:hypothetical protein [Clostridiales bacterium]
MPLVTSHLQLSEKLASYRVDQYLQKIDVPLDLTEMTATICSRILDQDPGLVADVASGKAERQALLSLISLISERENLRSRDFQSDLQRRVMDFLFGYGPLQDYIVDETISDIDGTGPDEFSFKANGRRQSLAVSFPDIATYDTFCKLVIIRNGGIINENDSHCRVTDERYRLRINVTVPPRSVRCASISIRKHRRQALSLNELENAGMFDRAGTEILSNLACSDVSVLFCGKGAAGKTTLLRAFIRSMPVLERVLIAESDCEIYPEKPYCLVQRIKKPNEGGRPVSLRDLVADGLTMSLDTYCIGEIVGEEALEFMRAAYSGHRCLATTHANSAADALDRLMTLARPAARGESERLMQKMLGKSIKYIVYMNNFKVKQILRVCNFSECEGEYEFAEVWPSQQDQETDTAAGVPAVT